MYCKVATLLLCLFFLAPIVDCTCGDNSVLNLTADALQYSASDNPFNDVYKEWWFFTFVDEAADIAWCMGYGVQDPSGEFNREGSSMAGMYWPTFTSNPQQLHNLLELHPFEAFSASKMNATVSVTAVNTITVVDEKTYLVVGASNDSILQWSLKYEQQEAPCRQKEDFAGLVVVDWISYMPAAKVTGTVSFEGKETTINAKGYHDHNWGVWPQSIFNWVWAEYSNASLDFSITLGGYNVPETSDYLGYLFLRINGTILELGSLCGDSFKFVPLKYQNYNGHKCSVSNHAEVSGTEWKVVVDYNAQVSGDNPGGIGLNLLVFEQVSSYHVQAFQKNGQDWQLVHDSEGLGFSEWSDVIHL